MFQNGIRYKILQPQYLAVPGRLPAADLGPDSSQLAAFLFDHLLQFPKEGFDVLEISID